VTERGVGGVAGAGREWGGGAGVYRGQNGDCFGGGGAGAETGGGGWFWMGLSREMYSEIDPPALMVSALVWWVGLVRTVGGACVITGVYVTQQERGMWQSVFRASSSGARLAFVCTARHAWMKAAASYVATIG
jgi:hypothetical protein